MDEIQHALVRCLLRGQSNGKVGAKLERACRSCPGPIIRCYGDVHMERTRKVSVGEVKLSKQAPRHLQVGITFSVLALSHHSWFLSLWFDDPPP